MCHDHRNADQCNQTTYTRGYWLNITLKWFSRLSFVYFKISFGGIHTVNIRVCQTFQKSPFWFLILTTRGKKGWTKIKNKISELSAFVISYYTFIQHMPHPSGQSIFYFSVQEILLRYIANGGKGGSSKR